MKAQKLYDLRAVTGIIAGTDLHDLFTRLTGDPSPSGKVEIDRQAIAADPVGAAMIEKLESPLAEALEEIKNYCDIP